jgi:hypothetical protein
MPRSRLALAATVAALGAAASAANAQLIVPTSQVREVRGESTWTDPGGNTMESGPLVVGASPGDYGFWSDMIVVPGFITGPVSQTGGFNGYDTLSLDAISFSIGGGGPPGTSAHAQAAIEFTYTFDVPAPVAYTTSININVAGPTGFPGTVVDFVATYTLTGPGGEVFSYQTAPETGFSINLMDATGTLPVGTYTLSLVIDGEVSFVATATEGNGAGGGAGGPSPILLFSVQPAAACPVDWNQDSQINSSDISSFLTSWLDSLNNQDLNADFDGNGAVNSSDISAFLSAWLQALSTGC